MDATWSQVEQAHGRDPLLLRQSLRAGTLVVCPLIALLQWQSEIARFTSPGALKVVLCAGLMCNSPFALPCPDAHSVLLYGIAVLIVVTKCW